MNEVRLTDSTAEIAIGSSRAEVVSELRAAKGQLTAAAVAERTGLHLNTARFHLDGLVDDGLATRTVQDRATPGRPRILYSIRAGATGPRSFGLLAEMLTGVIASLDGAGQAAINIGQKWGRQLVESVASAQLLNADEALARLNSVLDAVGFQPEISRLRDGKVEVNLHHCPFQEVAERHTDIVCALHLGLMQGTLSELGAPFDAESVVPFVKPDLCTATLRPHSAGAA